MKKEASWLHTPCVVSVLKSLAVKPSIPRQIKEATHIPGNYVNIILKKLEIMGIVLCLSPGEKIGKVFCISHHSKNLVEKVLKKSGYNLRVSILPDLNWMAYGRLNCGNCRQIRLIFQKAISLNNKGEVVTENNLEKELKDENGVLTIDRTDIYRAMRKLSLLGLLSASSKSHRQLQYEPTYGALNLYSFLNFQ